MPHNKENNELQTAAAFSRQSSIFDDLYGWNTIIKYKRERVRAEVNQYLRPNSKILELNAGTGEDSVYFAGNGHQVHATDISSGMLEMLSKKVKGHHLENLVSTEQCSFSNLDQLKNKGPYNHVFSNFAGLNCTDRLDLVLASLHPLLVPGGTITIVIMPPFCLWELALAFQGNFKAAFRRFNSRQGVTANVEGVPFTCWYYKPSEMKKITRSQYDILNIEGLCTLVPPSYFEYFADKRPALFGVLKKLESKLKRLWPWRGTGDYFIVSMKKI